VYPTTATISGFGADADADADSVFDFLAAGDADADADAEAGDGEEDMTEAVVAVVTAVEAKFLREMENGRALTTLTTPVELELEVYEYLKQERVRSSNGSREKVMFMCYFKFKEWMAQKEV